MLVAETREQAMVKSPCKVSRDKRALNASSRTIMLYLVAFIPGDVGMCKLRPPARCQDSCRRCMCLINAH